MLRCHLVCVPRLVVLSRVHVFFVWYSFPTVSGVALSSWKRVRAASDILTLELFEFIQMFIRLFFACRLSDVSVVSATTAAPGVGSEFDTRCHRTSRQRAHGKDNRVSLTYVVVVCPISCLIMSRFRCIPHFPRRIKVSG